jgi:threonine dehydratase
MAEKRTAGRKSGGDVPDQLSLQDIYLARRRIAAYAINTPMPPAPALAEAAGADSLFLKLESLQNSGAFKVRGAANKILSLSGEDRAKGVITFSTGNHGKAVAFVSGKSGVKATVCLSEHVPSYRAELIRSLGADVHIEGKSQDEAEAAYDRIQKSSGMIPVLPFDDPAVVAGQGTVALEMLEANPELDTLLVPLSGGGLLAGIALTAKLINPEIRIVGISIERSPAMLESLKAGCPVQVEEKDTLADSLLGGIGMGNRYTLPLIQSYVDHHLVVTEDEIAAGMYYALSRHSLVIEGAAAVGIGALLSGKLSEKSSGKSSGKSSASAHREVDCRGRKIGVVVSGSSVQLERYLELMRRMIDAEA